MTEPPTNPFVLPGMGQGTSDSASNPLLASMEMMRQAWSGLTGPGGLAQALPMTPPLSLEDLERRIAELRTVEGWLRMNLSMLSSTIQGMEVQRSTIATLRSFVDSIGAHQADPAMRDGPSPLEIVLGLKPAPGTGETAWGSAAKASPRGPAADTAPPEARDESATAGQDAPPESPHVASADAISHAAQSASEAWWGLLQQQFNQIAAATAATMPGAGKSPASGPAAAQPAAGSGGAHGTTPGTAPKSPASKAAVSKPAASKPSVSKPPVSKPRKTAARKLPSDSDQ